MDYAEEIEDDETSGYRTIRYCCYHKDGAVDLAIVYRYYTNEELEVDERGRGFFGVLHTMNTENPLKATLKRPLSP